jgi:hypothetical protein
MNSQFDPSLVFDEQAVGEADTEQVRVLRTSEGYSLRTGIGSPIHIVMETLELAIIQGSTVLLVIS